MDMKEFAKLVKVYGAPRILNDVLGLNEVAGRLSLQASQYLNNPGCSIKNIVEELGEACMYGASLAHATNSFIPAVGQLKQSVEGDITPFSDKLDVYDFAVEVLHYCAACSQLSGAIRKYTFEGQSFNPDQIEADLLSYFIHVYRLCEVVGVDMGVVLATSAEKVKPAKEVVRPLPWQNIIRDNNL